MLEIGAKILLSKGSKRFGSTATALGNKEPVEDLLVFCFVNFGILALSAEWCEVQVREDEVLDPSEGY